LTKDLANISETKLILDRLKEKRNQIEMEIKQLETHLERLNNT